MFLNFDKEERGLDNTLFTFPEIYTLRHRLKDYSKLSWSTSALVTTGAKPNQRSITPWLCAYHIEPYRTYPKGHIPFLGIWYEVGAANFSANIIYTHIYLYIHTYIYIYIHTVYTCTYIYIYTVHTYFSEEIHKQGGCWPTKISVDPSPLNLPNLFAETPLSWLAESENWLISHKGLTFGVPKSGAPGAVTADDA